MSHISLRDVSVQLPIYTARGRGLKATLLRRAVGGSIGADGTKDVVVIKALDHLDLEINEGERIGLVGHNGAGKTTLLRVLADIYPPTSGHVTVDGRVSSLTDLMMGMDTEASGYDNIRMRGILMGLTRRQAMALIPQIEEFTELGTYLQLPVRTYSAGMLVRLGFAVSTAIEADILILDEMIGAGDPGFIDKAKNRIESLIETAKIMVLASHDNAVLRRFCNRILWLEQGRIKMMGPTEEVLTAYEQHLGVAKPEPAASSEPI